MNAEDIYVRQVLDRIPGRDLQRQIGLELRSHIADRLERGESIDDAVRQLGDPVALAESYLAAIPLVRAPHLRRLAAKIVDALVIFSAPAMVLASGLLLGRPRIGGEPLADPVSAIVIGGAFLVTVLGVCLYTMLAEFHTGQTIGKRLFGLRVVTEAGTRISLGQSFLRQLPLFAQILTLDALFALFTEKRQRAFELISKTRVVVAQEPARAPGIAVGVHA